MHILTAVMLMATVSACNKEMTPADAIKVRASVTETKTYLSNGNHRWVTGDFLRILSDEGLSMKTSACDKAMTSFDFILSEWPSGKTPVYAVYCGQNNVTVEPAAEGDVITARLENNQYITHKNSFSKTANLSVGRLVHKSGGDYQTDMKNVCGLLKFSFSKYADIKTVTIQDMDSKPLAGTVDIMFDSKGEPYVSEVKEGAAVLNVAASGKASTLGNTDKAELPRGQDYYACVLPGTYSIKIILTRVGGERLMLQANSPVVVKRSSYTDLGAIDEHAKPLTEGALDNEAFGTDQNSGLPMHIDFSRVGYHWGEDALPTLPVKTTLTAPADGSDMTAKIQAALDATTDGAVLLKAGTYNLEGRLTFNHSRVVLRGEGDKTILFAKGKYDVNDEVCLITMGPVAKMTYSSESAIVENAPVGQLWVRVADPSLYKVADDVALFRPGTAEWISDIKMDQIAQNAENRVKQWTPSGYNLYSNRKVTAVKKDTVFLDNPVVMGLNDIYGVENRGSLMKVSAYRISECGLENIKLVSEFDDSEMDELGNHIDEDHCWSAISIQAAEHCWVRNVTSQYFGYCTVLMLDGARYITVTDCTSLHPVSEITGSRRYAFHISRGEMCLVKNCRAEEDRHAFVVGPRDSGPNVFAFCNAVNTKSDVGPHQRWAMGTLYDNQITDNLLAVQDGGNNGTGHGWRGTNFILWNCTAKRIACQSPWATGLNWCVGCIGERYSGRLKDRLPGEWISHGTPVSPSSLYEWQLSERQKKGIRLTQILL